MLGVLVFRLRLAVNQQGGSGWVTWTVLRKMRSLKIAVTEAGAGLAIALTMMMLEWSVHPIVCTIARIWILPLVDLISINLYPHKFFGISCTCILGLPAVKNLTVTAVTHTSITVSWIVSSRLYYQYYYCYYYWCNYFSVTPSQEEYTILDFSCYTKLMDHRQVQLSVYPALGHSIRWGTSTLTSNTTYPSVLGCTTDTATLTYMESTLI